MLIFSEIFELIIFLENIRILKEFEWFEWFGPSPIEPSNPGGRRRRGRGPELKGSIGEGPNHSNHSNSFKIGISPRKFKNFRKIFKFQHFLNYRRNSDKISSKSEQKSLERIQK